MRLTFVTILAASLFAVPALGEEVTPDEITTTTFTGTERGNFTPHGLAVTLGAGPTDFYSEDVSDLSDEELGGFADIRVAYGTRSYIGAEGVYWISGRSIDPDIAGEDVDTPQMVGYGGEILARGSYPMKHGELKYGPFAVAGLGWGTFGGTFVNNDDETEFTERDNVGTVPYGAGFAMSWSAFYGEARFMSRHVYDNDLVKDVKGDDADLAAWYAGLSLGATF